MEKIKSIDRPNEKEAKKNGKEILDERTEALIKENDELEEKTKEADKYLYLYSAVSIEGFLSDEELSALAEKWKEKLRRETDFLVPLDQLGIRIFCDDPENQPAFPGVKIKFGAAEIEEENIRESRGVAGRTHRNSKEIEVVGKKIPLRMQLVNFLHREGTVDSMTTTIIHELIHQEHFKTNPRTDSLLTEVQAHLSGVFGMSDYFAPVIAGHLTGDVAAKSYGFDKRETVMAVRAATTLLSLGMGQNELAAIITRSYFDDFNSRCEPLCSVAEERLKKAGLEPFDEHALDYALRLHTTNERLKAKLALCELIKEEFPMDKLKEVKIGHIRETVAAPKQFDENGKEVVGANFHTQLAICPVNEEFPYDPDGVRSGIVFGYVEHNKKPLFKVGRFDADAKNEKIGCKWVEGDEFDHYLEVIKKHSPSIKYESKDFAFSFFHSMGMIDEPFMIFFRKLASPDEVEDILLDDVAIFSRSFRVISDELESLRTGPEWSFKFNASKEKIDSYRAWVKEYHRIKKAVGQECAHVFERFDLDKRVERVEYILSKYSRDDGARDMSVFN